MRVFISILCLSISLYIAPLTCSQTIDPFPNTPAPNTLNTSPSLPGNTSPGNTPPLTPETRSLFEKALQSMEGNDLNSARNSFEELIFNHNEAPEISYLHLGEIYQKQGLLYEAASLYSQFMQHHPDHRLIPEALSRQGEIALNIGETQKAQDLFKQIILQYPQTDQAVKATFMLGDCLYKSGNKATAHLYYDEGIKQLPQYLNDHPKTAFNIASLCMKDDHLDEALNLFLTLEKNYPKLEITNKAVTFCGDLYAKMEKIPEAILTYQRVIDNYPESIGAQVSQIRMADLGVEHPEIVIEHPNSPLKAFHDPISAYRALIKTNDLSLAHLAEYKLGLALQKKKNHTEAIDTFRSLLAKAPETRIYQDTLYALKQELTNALNQRFKEKDYLKVIRIYEEDRDLLDPFWQEDKKPYFNTAQSYQTLGFYPPAIRLYKKILKIKGNSLRSQINLRLGQIFSQTEEYRKAADALREINSNHGSDPPSLIFEALSLSGDICLKQEDFAGAIDYYLAALNVKLKPGDIWPDKTEQLFKVGQCYQKLGKMSQAIQFLSKAADLAQKEKAPQHQAGTPAPGTPAQGTPAPGTPVAKIYLTLADCQYQTRQYAEALRTYQKVRELAIEPEDLNWVLFQTGNCSLKEAKPKAALDAFKNLKRAYPGTNNQDPMWSMIGDLRESEMNQRRK